MRNILPALSHDPARTKTRTAKAEADFKRRLKIAYRKVIEEVYLTIKPTSERPLSNSQAWAINSNRIDDLCVNEKLYYYDLDPKELMRLYDIIAEIMNRFLMVDKDGNFVNQYNPENLWFFAQYVEPSYVQGTEKARIEIAEQSYVYASLHGSLESVMLSETYQRRIGYVAAREFELMRGFTDSVIKEARVILSDAVAAGVSTKQAARTLYDRLSKVSPTGKNPVDIARAYRICQTEIPRAYRQAKQDEAENADVKYNIKSMIMPLSAFLKTSRKSHMKRHGDLVTYKEQKAFYDQAKNAINCHCSFVTVVLDEDGKPYSPSLVEKAKEQRDKMEKQFQEVF